MNLGASIKSAREKKGITQVDMARDCKMTQAYLSQIENNIKEPTISKLQVIAEYLETPLPILFFLALDSDDIKMEKRKMFNMILPAIKSMIDEFFISGK